MMPRMTPEDEEFARDCAGDAAVDYYLRAPVDYAMPVFVPGMREIPVWRIVVGVSAAIIVGFAMALR